MAVDHRCTTRNKELLHGGGFLVPLHGPASLVVSIIELLPNDLASSSSAATAQQIQTGGRVVCRRLCRQHAKVKLDKASQLVPADVQQALLKAYEEAAAEEE